MCTTILFTDYETIFITLCYAAFIVGMEIYDAIFIPIWIIIFITLGHVLFIVEIGMYDVIVVPKYDMVFVAASSTIFIWTFLMIYIVINIHCKMRYTVMSMVSVNKIFVMLLESILHATWNYIFCINYLIRCSQWYFVLLALGVFKRMDYRWVCV